MKLALELQPGANSWLDNADLRPAPKHIRTWGFWTYSYFWISAAATLANWYSPSAFMASGLTIWEAAVVHLAGQFLVGVTMVFSGRPGAAYHIGFPVVARASFGIVGAIWPIVNRAAMSIIWNGINVTQAGQCIYVMLHCIFPSIGELPNVMQQGDAVQTGGLIGILIAYLLMMATCFISIPKLKYLLFVKLAVFAISSVTMLAWTVSVSGTKTLHHSKTSHLESSKAWLIVKFTLLSWANCSTFIVNASDFQRYATRPNHVVLGQIIGFPLGNFIIAIVGIFVAQTSAARYGEVIWNPVLYLDRILQDGYTPANRAGCFFLALLFAFSCLFSCIYENILPGGNDMAALWPKYINVRRGCLICGSLSLACVPWKLMGTATDFIKWLSAYQIFLSAISGVLMCHYYFIARTNLNIPDLYRTNSQYWYKYGINWRAYAAYFLGVAPNFYGFLGNVGVKITKAGARYYYFAFPVGVLVAMGGFYLFNWYWPPPEIKKQEEMGSVDSMEEYVHETKF